MTAKDCYTRLLDLRMDKYDLRYCLVDSNKNPYKIDGARARVNEYDDFVSFKELTNALLEKWQGLGISVQASNIIGIDLDHCIESPLDYSTANQQARDIVDMFKDFAYVEFSFSGKGIRILTRQKEITPYRDIYYIKNSKIGIEYYQPTFDGKPSNRFLTITGNSIYNNPIITEKPHIATIQAFLDKYMRRATPSQIEPLNSDLEKNADKSLDDLLKIVRHCYLHDQAFQDDWFKQGIHPTMANRDESERDYRLIDYLYTHVTTDEETLRKVFEQSPFFKTKDSHHIHKWKSQDYRYYKLQYTNVKKRYK